MKKGRSRKEQLTLKRELILTTAQRLFMEKGYRAVTTREIAKECNITQPALYYHFADKETLYIAMLERFVAIIQAQLESVPKDTVAQRLEAMLEVLSKEHPTSIMMMVHDILVEFKEDNRRHIYYLWKQTYLNPFVNLFEDMKEDGTLRENISPEEAARFCLLTMGQTMSTWENKPQSLAGQYTLLVDLILHGTKAP
ncbi:TetR/AcrR family transcriptional regulator [Virgibacillus sp. NKC19-16]|uniref:TetR/AcrR family transcriptional regulator n=1 Tax=Virgibacillus salidurans TaxID=2831673 RepID=UPI001F323278|nr:TetR/AcrR family transcriptional regulator [Virgibacillus sp. NKC19-16]UJL46164.1 TetR/AcrR family transcriptional regulator [Virgibacillus sp. NKC19-16]